MPDTQPSQWTPTRSDLKASDPLVQQVEERIRTATDAHGIDQKHVDLLVEVGIEIFIFMLEDRVNDVERRVAALEGLPVMDVS